jgi:REP element-mobilizing transposase RayT
LPSVAQAFLSAGSRDFPVPCSGTGDWKVARTRRLESLRYIVVGLARETQKGHAGVVNPTPPPRGQQKLVAGLHSRGVLPHLKREGASYFVTFRLAGTLPKEVLVRFKVEREVILAQAQAAKRPLTWREQEELFRWYSSRVDKYLDEGRGECWLAQTDVAKLISGAINFHAGQRFDLHAWAVMPNHVHAVLHPRPDFTLSDILKSWKGFTAREANRMLKRTGQIFWQEESYDHLIRDDEDLHRCCHYTTMNPVNARLCKQPEDWKWSSAFRAKE